MVIPKQNFKFILYFLLKQRVKFSFLILTAIFWSINDTIYPYFLKRIINTARDYQGPPSGIFRAVWFFSTLLIVFWLLNEFLLRMQGIVSIYTFPQFRANIREATFDYVKLHSHHYFTNNFSGNIAKKLADLPMSCQAIMEITCFTFVTTAIGALIILGMMWYTKPLFAWIIVTWLILHLGLTSILIHFGNKRWEKHADAVAILSGKMIDILMNITNVRLFARSHFESQYLKHFQKDEIIKSKKAMWLVEYIRMGMGTSGLLLVFGILFTLLYSWSKRGITLGDFTQISMQSFWLLGWVWYVSYQLTVFIRESGTVSNAIGLIKHQHDIIDKPNAKTFVLSRGEILFNNVDFAYYQDQWIFKRLSVFIPSGQKVGLVGFSGSGKSTFVNLLLRFYDIQSGSISIDHQNIAEVTQDSLRQYIAMIPQDPSLFHRSLMENIRYGNLEANDEEVIQAAKQAYCHDFIMMLEEGYNTLVGERGVRLSGGQRQRIAIARATLKNAPILLLDEATSSLDTITEKLIHDSLSKLMRDKTTIIIAHRLSTLTNVDRILVFDKGKIIEDGSQQELLSQCGHFSKLWNMQSNGFLPLCKKSEKFMGIVRKSMP
ncbi:ABC transporter ATP-binding protein [Coxiella endosymbiont of Amblyomma nuttalli]|uniref:ABC transporter ATP-binding protein n=1 Tax=Coxiella endosymbiont of Amblyomma nuttalli TaxID=2749996 RepID=UPI001BA6817A|nr:ABC transporter ATP-binding protein [Coxiella endosymbiont of Amblyomma nuttalli]